MSPPKPRTFLEAQQALGVSTYRLGADIARSLRLAALAERWAAAGRACDERRRRYRRDVMGRHYDGL